MPSRGRPPKIKNVTVTLSQDEVQALVTRLGYKTSRDMLDDLAMGLIPPTADSGTPSSELPRMEGTGRSAEVAQPKSSEKSQQNPKLKNSSKTSNAQETEAKTANPKIPVDSWADKVELEEAQSSIQAPGVMIPAEARKEDGGDPPVKNWAEVIKAANQGFQMKFIAPEETVKFSKEEWAEGDSLWKHAVVCSIMGFKPSYADVEKWTKVNWKQYNPRISHGSNRGIDAPESSMPYGKDAKEELVKLVQGKSLRVLVYDQDRYGRCVGDIYCNGKFIQEVLLKKGLAWHYTAYDHRSQLENWEKEARAKRVGLWASSNPQKPWEYRKDKREHRN